MTATTVLQAIGLFMATNIDDIIILSLFFARGAGQRGTTTRIALGQYLGFVGILGAALLVAWGAGLVLPSSAIPYFFCVVFLLLVGVLVLLARYVATRRPIAEVLERWEHVLFPIVLIGLGIAILVSGGAFGL